MSRPLVVLRLGAMDGLGALSQEAWMWDRCGVWGFLWVSSALSLVGACAGEEVARLPDAPVPAALGQGCDGAWFASAFELEVSERLGDRTLDLERLAMAPLGDDELMERARGCLEPIVWELARPGRSRMEEVRRGLAFALLVQGRLAPDDWLGVFRGYRSRRLASCVARSSPGARLKCGHRLDGEGPDPVVMRTCRELSRAALASPAFGQLAAEAILEEGLSSYALTSCLNLVVGQMWRREAALDLVLSELGEQPNGGQLAEMFGAMGAELLPHLGQLAAGEDRLRARGQTLASEEGGRECYATRLFWALVREERVVFEGEFEDVVFPAGAGCEEQIALLGSRATAP